jgi:hypothetical protein
MNERRVHEVARLVRAARAAALGPKDRERDYWADRADATWRAANRGGQAPAQHDRLLHRAADCARAALGAGGSAGAARRTEGSDAARR